MFVFISIGETRRKKDNNGSLSFSDYRELKVFMGKRQKSFEGIMVISIGAK